MHQNVNIIPFIQKENPRLRVLIVEDSRMERIFLAKLLEEFDYDIIEAENGQEALDVLLGDAQPVDIVLVDKMMPVLDGLSVVIRMKEEPKLSKIPVIMITGAANNRDMAEGIDAGVFYYLQKPLDRGVFHSVLTAAVREVKNNNGLLQELRRQSSALYLMETCKFVIRTIDDAEALAAFIARSFPEPQRTVNGLAELMINAVEHGIYKLGYAAKSELISLGIWRAELEKRAQLPEYASQSVEVVVSRKPDGHYVVITDAGEGFEWSKYLNIDPARATDNHGRGIARALAESFDRIAFNTKGNQVVAFVSNTPSLKW